MEVDLDLEGSFQLLNTSFVGFKKKQNAFTSRAEVFYYSGNENSCINAFVSLRQLSSGEGNTALSLSWTHPCPPVILLARYPNLGKFCFANEATSHTVSELVFTFVLTDSSGFREYGHVSTAVNGEAIVVMSPYPWCNFFYRLAYLYRVNGEEGKNMVRALCRCATPPSGASFVIPRQIPVNFRRPYDRMCSFIDTAPLRMLNVFPDLDDLFSVLADLLLEKHIIIVGPNFSLVSTVVMSLQALIAPFDWMHILIPIVPSSLMDVLAAPPPFLVGVLTSQLPLLQKVPIENAIVVRLNSDGICERVAYINETPSHLPHSGWFSGVRMGLHLLKLQSPERQRKRDLCNLFLTYYASLFGEIVLRGPKGYIHNKENMSAATIAFYEMLLTTQSFANLSDYVNRTMQADNNEWVDNEFIVAAVRANPQVFPRHYQHLISEEQQGGGYVAKHNDCFGSSEVDTTSLIDGFGGHRQGLSRLAIEFALGCCQRQKNELMNSDDYYPGQYDWISRAEERKHRHLGGPVMEAEEEMTAVQSAEFVIVHADNPNL